jgi:hypothetical protein
MQENFTKIWGRIRNPEKFIPDPVVKKAPDPEPQHWVVGIIC